jgi:hypothetical protein
MSFLVPHVLVCMPTLAGIIQGFSKAMETYQQLRSGDFSLIAESIANLDITERNRSLERRPLELDLTLVRKSSPSGIGLLLNLQLDLSRCDIVRQNVLNRSSACGFFRHVSPIACRLMSMKVPGNNTPQDAQPHCEDEKYAAMHAKLKPSGSIIDYDDIELDDVIRLFDIHCRTIAGEDVTTRSDMEGIAEAGNLNQNPALQVSAPVDHRVQSRRDDAQEQMGSGTWSANENRVLHLLPAADGNQIAQAQRLAAAEAPNLGAAPLQAYVHPVAIENMAVRQSRQLLTGTVPSPEVCAQGDAMDTEVCMTFHDGSASPAPAAGFQEPGVRNVSAGTALLPSGVHVWADLDAKNRSSLATGSMLADGLQKHDVQPQGDVAVPLCPSHMQRLPFLTEPQVLSANVQLDVDDCVVVDTPSSTQGTGQHLVQRTLQTRDVPGSIVEDIVHSPQPPMLGKPVLKARHRPGTLMLVCACITFNLNTHWVNLGVQV